MKKINVSEISLDPKPIFLELETDSWDHTCSILDLYCKRTTGPFIPFIENITSCIQITVSSLSTFDENGELISRPSNSSIPFFRWQWDLIIRVFDAVLEETKPDLQECYNEIIPKIKEVLETA